MAHKTMEERVKMSHNDRLKEMFLTKPYVTIEEIRGWCNYRSRISDLRGQGLDIQAVMVTIAPGAKPVHAYRLVPMTKEVLERAKHEHPYEFRLATSQQALKEVVA